jgi:sodium transport system ATP-binding protein
MPRWREVRTLYAWEFRSALRERTIVVNSILIPIFLYPFILWAMFTGITFVMGQTEGMVSRVAVAALPAGHADLGAALRKEKGIEIMATVRDRAQAAAAIRTGDLDAYLEFTPAASSGLAGNFSVRLTFDESKERSATARTRVTAVLDRYRDAWLRREAEARGVTPAEWEVFALERRNVASARQIGRFMLGLMLPLFFVIMVAVGCFYPAIDATAGERERGTWETLMSVAASRASIVTAKYLYVASFGFLAGALNLTAMVLTMRPVLAPLLARSGDVLEFSVPLVAVPILAIAAVLLAAFVAAGMMIFAAFARTFREGQSMITPFYLVLMLPVLFLQVPDLQFTRGLACIPVVNVAMMVREAIGATFHWPQIGLTLVVSLSTVAAGLFAAGFILRFEDVVVGSFTGLTKVFYDDTRGEIRAVDHIDFACRAGEIFGLLGANGAGKTTTLRMLATILKPTSGAAAIMDHDVGTDPEAVRRSIGFYSSSTALYPRLTGRETLEFFARINGCPPDGVRDRVDRLVARFGLAEYANVRVDRLSTGMKQKVSIARTVAHDPPVLIFDEPTVGLDVLNALELQKVIAEFRDEGKAVIFSTHIMSEAERLCNRIAIIHRGRIHACDTLDRLREATGHRYLEDIFVHYVKGAERESRSA